MPRTDVLIIGAGQAGLAMSRCLAARGIEHVLLERGRVAEAWRRQRWASLRLLTPNWMTRLPGHRYDGPDPDGFMPAGALAGLLDRYAASFGAPVVTGAGVRVLVASGDGDGYSIGGNHFLHACRRNVDLTYIVMDNHVYGMTKGQPSPTTEPGPVTTWARPRGRPASSSSSKARRVVNGVCESGLSTRALPAMRAGSPSPIARASG